MIRRTGRSASRRGFTMVEAIATIIVLGIIGSVTSGIVLQAVDGYTEAATQAQLHSEISIGLDRAVREIRKIPLDAGATGIAPDIDAVAPTSIDWQGDYQLIHTAGGLELRINGGTRYVLMSDVQSFQLAAFDESNAALAPSLSGAACDAIRRIEMSLTASRHGVSATVRTRVHVRSTIAGAG